MGDSEAWPARLPSLGYFVRGVVLACTKKQVVRPHARRVVAFVTDLVSRRYRFAVQFHGQTVSSYCAAIPTATPDLAIPAANG